jgi:hypothetical protein
MPWLKQLGPWAVWNRAETVDQVTFHLKARASMAEAVLRAFPHMAQPCAGGPKGLGIHPSLPDRYYPPSAPLAFVGTSGQRMNCQALSHAVSWSLCVWLILIIFVGNLLSGRTSDRAEICLLACLLACVLRLTSLKDCGIG